MKAKFLIIILLFISSLNIYSQIFEPVKWQFSSNSINSKEAELVFTAKIDKGWYLYGLDIPEGGPVATAFYITADDKNFKTIGKVIEPKGKVKFDPNFEMELKLFEKEAIFKQKIKINSAKDFNIKGYLEFMCCNNTSCLPPTDVSFDIKLKMPLENEANTPPVIDANDLIEDTIVTEVNNENLATHENINQANINEVIQDIKTEKSSLFWVLIMGLLGGLLALVTPCVFPLIPMTVSFFLRSTKSRKKAISDAFFYGLFIIVIYVVMGFAISVFFGANALNSMATSPIFNIVFFALLIIFAISFFGVFELQMPSKWTTALDSKADKSSGLVSIFFMSFTLVLVSFSCTGPIIGTLLVEAAVSGNKIAPLVGMAGFAIALAIPFTLLAIFPSWLKSMPKSGGWLNAVKVVLAFILLALSLKFLSTADMVGQWNLLSRPIYLALWIVIFSMMGLYLLGKIKFSHDSDMPYLSVPRLFLALGVFTFVVYMIPGMFGAPLKAISSFLPPMTTQDFVLGGQTASTATHIDLPADIKSKLGAHGLLKITDYEDGIKYANDKNKPIFLDFTGLGCVNCKKMEADVWGDQRVIDKLKNDYVIISLYVDDRTTLPEEEQYVSTLGGKERKIRTVGHKWSDFQATRFGINSQPYYLLLDLEGNKLIGEAFSYNTHVEAFLDFLNKGTETFDKK